MTTIKYDFDVFMKTINAIAPFTDKNHDTLASIGLRHIDDIGLCFQATDRYIAAEAQPTPIYKESVLTNARYRIPTTSWQLLKAFKTDQTPTQRQQTGDWQVTIATSDNGGFIEIIKRGETMATVPLELGDDYPKIETLFPINRGKHFDEPAMFFFKPEQLAKVFKSIEKMKTHTTISIEAPGKPMYVTAENNDMNIRILAMPTRPNN